MPWLGLFSAPNFLGRAADPGNLGFLLGIFVALIISLKPVLPARLVTMFGLAIFSVGAWLDVAQHRPYPLLYLLASFLLVLGLAGWDRTASSPAPKAATALGTASYSIYLVHYPVISILSKLLIRAGRLHPEVFFILITTGALLVSLLFYRLVERPLLAALRTWALPKKPAEKLTNEIPTFAQP